MIFEILNSNYGKQNVEIENKKSVAYKRIFWTQPTHIGCDERDSKIKL